MLNRIPKFDQFCAPSPFSAKTLLHLSAGRSHLLLLEDFNSDFDSKIPERNITNKDANALQVMRCGALRCEGRRAACWGWRAKTPGRPHQRPGPARSGRWRRGPPPHPGTRRRQRPLHRQTVAVLPRARGQRLMSMTSSVSRISVL